MSALHLDRPFHLPAGVDPVSVITQGYGPTTVDGEPPGFFYPDRSIDYYRAGPGAVRYDRLHCGVDYGIVAGTPLYAPADGTAATEGLDTTGFGLSLHVDHGDITTLYAHLTRIVVPHGKAVKRGDMIAYSGGNPNNEPDSGFSNGDHLHWSVIRNSDGRFVDPAPFVDAPMPPPPKPKPPIPDPVHLADFVVIADSEGHPVRVFDGPSTKLAVRETYLAASQLGCDAWCFGEARMDASTNRFDARWYHLVAGGWVASSRVTGNAPGSNPLP